MQYNRKRGPSEELQRYLRIIDLVYSKLIGEKFDNDLRVRFTQDRSFMKMLADRVNAHHYLPHLEGR